MAPVLSVVSVCYNSGELFRSPKWQTFLQNTDLNIVLVDNNSPDNSGQLLASSYPQHNVLQLGQNIGYGRAANAGIRECGTRYVLLLNPDILIEAESIDQLLKVAVSDTETTAVWAPILNPADYRMDEPLSVEAVTGAAMLFDLHKFQDEELFDKNIFLYSEETDLCYRTRQRGNLIKLCPAILLDHKVDGSSGHHPALTYMKSWHFAWSRCYFLNKHNLSTKKCNAGRMYRNYKIKSFTSWTKVKRSTYRAQAAGVKDFLEGKKAFTSDDKPQMSNFLSF